ncbi:MAG: sugar transferase [Chloroflexi bacterium]|nr:sugar transferase [Chloroflexota bacterium]
MRVTAAEARGATVSPERPLAPTPFAVASPGPRGRGSLVSPLLMVLSDLIAIHLAFYAAWYMRYVKLLGGDLEPENFVGYDTKYFPLALVLSGLLVLVSFLGALYRRQQPSFLFNDWANLAVRTAFGVAAVSWTAQLYRWEANSRLTFLYVWVFATLLVSGGRLLVQMLTGVMHRRGLAVERVLVVGEDTLGRMVMQSLAAQPHLGLQVVGFLASDRDSDFGRFRFLGPVDAIDTVCGSERIDQVIVALPTASHDVLLRIVDHCRQAGVRFKIVPDVFEMSISRVDLDTMSGIPLIDLKEVSIIGWQAVQKRALDLVLGALLVLVAAIPMAIIAVAIKLTSRGSVIFRQTRVGRNGETFTMFKFRSMYENAHADRERFLARNMADGPLFKLKEDPRITPVGRMLRKFSLDELPQLFNVMRGEMSLVGPRPALPAEVQQYEEWQMRRLHAPPGMTGLWQVSGRSELSFEEMVVLDLTYIQNWSLSLDASILIRTMPAVLLGSGAF